MNLGNNNLKIVLDTNIYLSAILFGGIIERILRFLEKEKVLIYVSPFILNEIKKVLKRKFHWKKEMIDLVIKDIQERTILIKPTIKTSFITEKKDDNKILDCALFCKAHYLITGDKKHIVPLKRINDTEIISPGKFYLRFVDSVRKGGIF